MKIFGLEIRRSKKDEEQRSYYFNDALNFSSVYNRYTAMNVSAVYRAVEIISDSIAMLPIKVKTKDGQHHNVMEGHPVELAIYDKYGTISKFTLMKLLIQSVMLRGNGYALIERAEDGTVKAIRYIPSENVLINYNPLKPEQLFYQISGIKGRIEPVNMIHLVKNTYDGVNGISVLQFGARAIDLANNTENSANGFFENGCNLAGILTVQGQLTDQQKEDIRTFEPGGKPPGFFASRLLMCLPIWPDTYFRCFKWTSGDSPENYVSELAEVGRKKSGFLQCSGISFCGLFLYFSCLMDVVTA